MKYRLLGPLEVRGGDGTLPLGSAKQRAVLALLLLSANRVVPRARLIDELWGDQLPETAVTTVQVYVSRLRKLLPEGVSLTRPPGYLLSIEPDGFDLLLFESLVAEARKAEPRTRLTALARSTRALAGPALAEFAGEPFARLEAGRLEGLRLAALEERIEADLALGRHSDLIGELEVLIAEHPHRERLRAQLIVALYRSSRQADALAAYRDARSALDELGIEPGAKLRELERQMLTQDTSLDLAPQRLLAEGQLVGTQPTGTVTLLFSDVESSTRLLESLGVERYAEVLGLHRQVLRRAFGQHGGYEVDQDGDSFFVVFSSAAKAVAAASEAQRTLAAADWQRGVDLRVRMGIHTGEPLPVPPKYVGLDVHRASRVMAAAHGKQVLVSETTAALIEGVPLRDLGAHRLKDLLEPIHLHQLLGDGLPDTFPPPRTLRRTNLPLASWPLVGREQELAQIHDLFSDGGRLVTLTGPGGSGKTRLALQAAAELSEGFEDGVFFVGLAPVRESWAVPGAVAEALELPPDADLLEWLASKRALLVVDNLEHLEGVDVVVAQLLVGETTILGTSRSPLRLMVEQELAVDPLPDDAAVELFVSRAAAVGRRLEADETVAELCRRLDNLPLALELAAARAKLLPPKVMLRRLEAVLPLLASRAADRPERQRTLRATIEWSHDLLDRRHAGDLPAPLGLPELLHTRSRRGRRRRASRPA